MKITLTEGQFIQRFHDYGRSNQFTYKALVMLFNYFKEYEAETGEEIEADIIGICCDYTEETLKDWAENNDHDQEQPYADLMDLLSDKTYIVGDYTNEKGESVVIYQNY
jgi:hypothetical protein